MFSLKAEETTHWLAATFAERTTEEHPLSEQTCTSYEVAPDTSPQSKVGVVEIPVAPFAGITKLTWTGSVQTVVNDHIELHEPGPQALLALARQ